MVETGNLLEGGVPTVRTYYIELRYLLPGLDQDTLDQHSDDLTDALLVEPNLIDPDVGVNFSTGAVDVCASVQAEDDPAALRLALVAIRSAAHHAGTGTPAWDRVLDEISSRVRPAEMADL